jgi:hypothetical protein
MEQIIEAIRLIIHRQDFQYAEAAFVEATRPLYRSTILVIFLLASLVAIGIASNIYGYTLVNVFLWMICMATIIIITLYARYIFITVVGGAAFGAAKTGVSGLQGGVNFLKQYINAAITLAMVITGIFGALSFINFSWTSAGVAVFAGMMIGLSNLKLAK